MKTLLGILLVVAVHVQAQGPRFETVYSKAMQDSVITADEQALLDLFLPQSDSLQMDTMTAPQVQNPELMELNQEGRWRQIYYTMVLGNTLYGFGIPYLLKVKNPINYVGFQAVAAAGGFLWSYGKTKDSDMSVGRTSFIQLGGNLGIASLFPLHAAVGWDNWREMDPNYRAALAYTMLSAPYGMLLGERLYEKWQPSDGQALAIGLGTSIGLGNGFALHQLIQPFENIDTGRQAENAYRMLTAFSYGGALAGGYYAHKYLGDEPLTTGDVQLIKETTALGAFIAVRLYPLFSEDAYRPKLLTAMAFVNGFTWLGIQLVDDVDFTEGDAAIVAMGTIAANSVWQGIRLIASGDMDDGSLSTIDILSASAGFFLTYKSVKEIRQKRGYPSKGDKHFKYRVKPSLWGNMENPVPGLSMELTFNRK